MERDPYYWHHRRQFWIHIAIMIGTEMGQIDVLQGEKRAAHEARRQRLMRLNNKCITQIGHLESMRVNRCYWAAMWRSSH
jgi:hypothetical protein